MCDIGTLSIDTETKNIFMNKSHKKWNQKLGPDPILILLNNPKLSFNMNHTQGCSEGD